MKNDLQREGNPIINTVVYCAQDDCIHNDVNCCRFDRICVGGHNKLPCDEYETKCEHAFECSKCGGTIQP